jgi:drug/metabolite transporter (DMT)-like permease
MKTRNRSPVLGTAIGVAAVLIGSPTFILVRVLRHHNAFEQLLLRSPFFLCTALLFAVPRWCSCRNSTTTEDDDYQLKKVLISLGWKGLIGCLFLAFQSIAIVVSLLLTRMSNVAFIINTSPIFCAVCVGLIAIGIILGGDFDGDSSLMLGNAIALINPISWTIFWAVVRRNSSSEVGIDGGDVGNDFGGGSSSCASNKRWDDLLVFQLGSGAIIMITGGIGIAFGASWKDPNEIPLDWFTYWIYGGVVLPLCVTLFSLAPMFISTTEMGILKMLEMVLIPIYGYFYADEVPTVNGYIGGSILLATLLIHGYLTMKEQNICDGDGDANNGGANNGDANDAIVSGAGSLELEQKIVL